MDDEDAGVDCGDDDGEAHVWQWRARSNGLLNVRDGVYSVDERRFIGFEQSIQTYPGLGQSDTINVVTHYHSGRGADRVLRGQVLSQQTQDGTGNVFKQVTNLVQRTAHRRAPDDGCPTQASGGDADADDDE